jgi:hypothetical protein
VQPESTYSGTIISGRNTALLCGPHPDSPHLILHVLDSLTVTRQGEVKQVAGYLELHTTGFLIQSLRSPAV